MFAKYERNVNSTHVRGQLFYDPRYLNEMFQCIIKIQKELQMCSIHNAYFKKIRKPANIAFKYSTKPILLYFFILWHLQLLYILCGPHFNSFSSFFVKLYICEKILGMGSQFNNIKLILNMIVRPQNVKRNHR